MPLKKSIKTTPWHCMISRLLCSLCFGIFSVFGVGLVAMMLLLERLEEAAVLLRPDRCLTSGPWIINDVFLFHGFFPWKVPYFHWLDMFYYDCWSFFLLFELFPVQRWCVSMKSCLTIWSIHPFQGSETPSSQQQLHQHWVCKIYWSNCSQLPAQISPCHLASFTLHPPQPPGGQKNPGEDQLLQGLEKLGMSALLSPVLSVFALPWWAPESIGSFRAARINWCSQL